MSSLGSMLGSSLLLRRAPRLAPARLQLSAPFAACRCLRTRGTRPNSFWHKWEQRSQQQFWQEVGLNQDKPYERRQLPSQLRAAQSKDEADADEYDDFDLLPSAFDEAEAGEYDEDGWASLPADGRAQPTAEEVRDRLVQDDAADPQRRAELLGLIEQFGVGAALPKKKDEPGEGGDVFGAASNPEEEVSKAIMQTRSSMEMIRLKASGRLKPGQLFCHVLHSRSVSKVKAQGKVRTFSVLVVVGNGQGTAGYGLGKDLDSGMALHKAAKAAKRSLVHVDRFDSRTLFHEFEERYSATKIIVNLRRAHSGTRCNWLMWKIFHAFGISDVSVKVHGSHNNLSQTYAIFNGLQRMSTPQQIANRRGLRVLDMTPRSRAGQAGNYAD